MSVTVIPSALSTKTMLSVAVTGPVTAMPAPAGTPTVDSVVRATTSPSPPAVIAPNVSVSVAALVTFTIVMSPSPVDAAVTDRESHAAAPSLPCVNRMLPIPVSSVFTVVGPVGTLSTTMSPSVAWMSIVSVFSVSWFRFPIPPPPPVSSTAAPAMSTTSFHREASFIESSACNAAVPAPAVTLPTGMSLMSRTLMPPRAAPSLVSAFNDTVASTSKEPAVGTAPLAAMFSP